MPSSRWLTAGQSIEGKVRTLLSFIPPERIVLRKKLIPRQLIFPAVVIAYATEREADLEAAALSRFWEYPFQLGIFTTKLPDLKPDDQAMIARELIFDNFDGYRLDGVPFVSLVTVEPLDVVNDELWQEQNLDASLLNLRCRVKVARPRRPS
jgi:hypothetical protein